MMDLFENAFLGCAFEMIYRRFFQFNPLLEQALITDERLTEAEQEIERNRMEVLRAEQLASMNLQKAEELEFKMGEMRIRHEQSLVTLEARLTAEHNAQIASVQRQLENKRREVNPILQ
jgi:hypothetical protein